MSTVKQILVAIASDSVFTQFEPLMTRSDLSITRVRSGQHALTLARNLKSDLVVCQHPLSDLGFTEFHSGLRLSDCASCHSPLLVLTRDDRLDALVDSLDDEDAQMFCLDLAPEQLEKALNEIIGVATRARSRLLVETRVDCHGEATSRVFQTTNISESGFLLRSSSLLPIGSRTKFALTLPEHEDQILGIAEVARYTEPETEGFEGMAMRLIRVEGEGRARLAEFINGQTPGLDKPP
ncbi:MAG: PilZ domain-containing protein [Acidobacteriota bacterium]|nr:PilZ domain-containing protein [Acidobacteriota bacterium]